MLEETPSQPCGGRYANVLEAVGYTPIVELPRLSPKPGVRIFAKLEGRNPTDRRRARRGQRRLVVPDDGWKYLSSGVYTKSLDELEGVETTLWW